MTSESFGAGWRRFLAAQPIYLWLLALVVAPNVLLLGSSFFRSDSGAIVQELTLANYLRIFERATYPTVLLSTVLVALGAACLASFVAYPMAYFVSRRVTRYKLTAILLIIIPLWVSLLIRVFAWKIILGENGVLNSFLVSWNLLDQPTQVLLYTRFTVFLTFTYVAIPYVFITSYTALERIPRSLIEASRDAGASGWQTFRRIVWPLSKQGLAIGFALAFLISVGDYVTPSMVGGLNGTMMGMIIASQFGLAGNWPFGAALAIALMLCVALVLAIVAAMARTRGVIESGGPSTAAEAMPWGSLGVAGHLGRIVTRVLFVLPYVVLYGPLAVIALFSLNDSQLQALPLAGFSLRWYHDLLADRNLFAALERSLVVGISVVLASMVVGTAFAMLFSQARIRAAVLLQSGIAIPVVLPGIVLGIALALTFRLFQLEPGLFNVIIGHMTFVMPVIMLIVLARLRGLDPSLAQASADLGANRRQTFLRITLPLIRSAIVGGGLLGFTLSFDEVIVTLFLTGPKPTLPVFIWNQLRFGFTPTVNAAFTLIGLTSLVVVTVATWFLRAQPSRPVGRDALPGMIG